MISMAYGISNMLLHVQYEENNICWPVWCAAILLAGM